METPRSPLDLVGLSCEGGKARASSQRPYIAGRTRSSTNVKLVFHRFRLNIASGDGTASRRGSQVAVLTSHIVQ